MKVGDKVMIGYFGVSQIGEIIKITPTKVRVRFKNCRGSIIEAWRKKDRVYSI